MTDSAPEDSSATISDFVASHCMTCAAGWTRRSAAGGVIVVCLLDREPVWPDMDGCDRYEQRG
jgi:hypothetical protein